MCIRDRYQRRVRGSKMSGRGAKKPIIEASPVKGIGRGTSITKAFSVPKTSQPNQAKYYKEKKDLEFKLLAEKREIETHEYTVQRFKASLENLKRQIKKEEEKKEAIKLDLTKFEFEKKVIDEQRKNKTEELEKQKETFPNKRVTDPEVEIFELDKQINKEELRRSTSTLTKEQERAILTKIEQLTLAKSFLRGWRTKQEQLSSLTSKSNFLYSQIKRLKDQSQSIEEAVTEKQDEAQKLQNKIDKINKIIDEKKSLVSNYSKSLDEVVKHLKTEKDNLAMQKNIFYEQQTKSEKQIVPKKEATEVLYDFSKELEICDCLIDHLNHYSSVTLTKLQKTEKPEDEVYHPFEMIVNFEKVSAEIPILIKDVDESIRAIAEKKKYYENLRDKRGGQIQQETSFEDNENPTEEDPQQHQEISTSEEEA
eukprot:TRINITY_DN3052_c0_g4_i1.p1 TRINITY_DN3052_c0_g4~~TRINITY_DN3052_c0_g4_i1.p1  ORF type:complete len:424 (+),score=121.58 TRINITY_DN3052_c0_g4_i1:3-1274(+)